MTSIRSGVEVKKAKAHAAGGNWKVHRTAHDALATNKLMGEPSMSKAKEQIIDEYVRLNHRLRVSRIFGCIFRSWPSISRGDPATTSA
jgi:hypothetical protein